MRRLVQANLDSLSNAERKVARALLAGYPTAGLTTGVDLARAAGVSNPTVVRFVNRLGFSGFPAFQRALVHDLNEDLGSPLRQYAEKGGLTEEGVLARTHRHFVDMVDTTYEELPESEFDKLVQLLSDPGKQVQVIGGRFSRVVSDYLAMHLSLVRTDVRALGMDEFERRASIIDADQSTVLVVFDYRRYTERTFRLAEQASQRGAIVCLLTDNWMSPVAKVAKVVLPARVDSASPFDSLVAAMAVTESLIAAVAERLGSAGEQRLRAMEETPDP
ncbi:MurR/RpiR family transcriptional regulator [Nocardioides hwasunensis]|uniref:MurR/RpiR family transcriptional regulator n=2 Tax=Nocardioides hwasunensis TaxID=397258 RepID=A0ABR8MM14_9ACTN|nr:MurR/RpiR family transcriptional regulator [Nocardioides hwasunensis]